MKAGDHVFFAPGVPFSDLDLTGAKLGGQYRARIEGYFLDPAQRCVAARDSFAAGLLAVVAIDAMSRLYFGPNRRSRRVGQDFQTFARLLLPSFAHPKAAKILYESFRNGLVHEARLKDGCQFGLGRPQTVDTSGPFPIIDPARLISEVRSALVRLLNDMQASKRFQSEFVKLLRQEFAFELGDAA